MLSSKCVSFSVLEINLSKMGFADGWCGTFFGGGGPWGRGGGWVVAWLLGVVDCTAGEELAGGGEVPGDLRIRMLLICCLR